MESVNIQAARTIVVSDHRLHREVLARCLASESDIEIAGTTGSVEGARSLVAGERVDVVILEAGESDLAVMEWFAEMKLGEDCPKLVVLADRHDEDAALRYIGAGAEAYLLNDSSCEQLISAIERVLTGEYVFDPALAVPVVRRVAASLHTSRSAAETPTFVGLSNREKEIAALASQGMTNEKIAEAMFITPNTVKTHLRRVYQRLGICSRRQLMQKYLRAA